MFFSTIKLLLFRRETFYTYNVYIWHWENIQTMQSYNVQPQFSIKTWWEFAENFSDGSFFFHTVLILMYFGHFCRWLHRNYRIIHHWISVCGSNMTRLEEIKASRNTSLWFGSSVTDGLGLVDPLHVFHIYLIHFSSLSFSEKLWRLLWMKRHVSQTSLLYI